MILKYKNKIVKAVIQSICMSKIAILEKDNQKIKQEIAEFTYIEKFQTISESLHKQNGLLLQF